MRPIDADALIDTMTGACNIFDVHGIDTTISRTLIAIAEQAPTISVKPKRESMAMLPCKCGCKLREHWYGNKKDYERTLVCKRCGFEVHGRNDRDVIRKWNEAVKGDG